MTKVIIATSVTMFGVSFLFLAACYSGLPVEFPVLRSPLAGALLFAPKSLFTVFRIPLMNLTHGLMAAVMLSCAKNFEGRTPPGILFRYLLEFAVRGCPQIGL
jgi:hypothetical protein